MLYAGMLLFFAEGINKKTLRDSAGGHEEKRQRSVRVSGSIRRSQHGGKFIQGDNVGILAVHVKQVDRVRGLMSIVDTVFYHDDAITIGASVYDAGAHASGSAFTAHDEGVDTQGVEVGFQRSSEKDTGAGFFQYRLTGQGGCLVNDLKPACSPFGHCRVWR